VVPGLLEAEASNAPSLGTVDLFNVYGSSRTDCGYAALVAVDVVDHADLGFAGIGFHWDFRGLMVKNQKTPIGWNC
jgi:hypothetical protein